MKTQGLVEATSPKGRQLQVSSAGTLVLGE